MKKYFILLSIFTVLFLSIPQYSFSDKTNKTVNNKKLNIYVIDEDKSIVPVFLFHKMSQYTYLSLLSDCISQHKIEPYSNLKTLYIYFHNNVKNNENIVVFIKNSGKTIKIKTNNLFHFSPHNKNTNLIFTNEQVAKLKEDSSQYVYLENK